MVKKYITSAERVCSSANRRRDSDSEADSVQDWSDPPPAPLLKPQKVGISKGQASLLIRLPGQSEPGRD